MLTTSFAAVVYLDLDCR